MLFLLLVFIELSFKFRHDVYIQPYPYGVESFGLPGMKEISSWRKKGSLTCSSISPPAGNPYSWSLTKSHSASFWWWGVQYLKYIWYHCWIFLVANSFFLFDRIQASYMVISTLYSSFIFLLFRALAINWMFVSPVLYVENSNTQCGGIWRWDFWEEISHERWALWWD